MFVLDSGGDDVNEYTLTTGFDISTASHAGSFSVASQETTPVGIDFNNDGTKMFVAGWQGEDINEYALTSPFSLVDVSGENTGDVIDTSSSSNEDTDADTDASLTITAIRTGGTEGSGTAGTVGSALTGTYGQLTINANGSYSYVANQSAADALDAGDVVTDAFNYTVSDGTATDTAVITITVIGINDAPTAVDDTDTVLAGNTVTDTTNSAGTLVSDDTDPDASSSLYITQVTPSGGSASQLTYNSTKLANSTNISGSKGTLTIGSDGSYSYAASSGATAGDDVFTYILTDGTSTTTATLTISVTAANSAPTASNSTVYINENNQVSSAGDRTPSNITKIFAASDFNYSDADSDSLSKIQITTLESAGALEYSSDGSTWTDVTLNQEITATDIGNNKLRFTPAANSESDVTFGFKVHDGNQYSSSAYTMTVSVNAAALTDTVIV